MVYDEPCTIGLDGTLFRGRPQKNEALTLCVGTSTNWIPFLNVLGFGR